MDTYRSRTDVTGLRSRGSTIELMTHNILEHIGLEPINLFHAMEVLYHCANAPSKNHPKCQSATELHEFCDSGSGEIRILILLSANQVLRQIELQTHTVMPNKKTRLLVLQPGSLTNIN